MFRIPEEAVPEETTGLHPAETVPEETAGPLPEDPGPLETPSALSETVCGLWAAVSAAHFQETVSKGEALETEDIHTAATRSMKKG